LWLPSGFRQKTHNDSRPTRVRFTVGPQILLTIFFCRFLADFCYLVASNLLLSAYVIIELDCVRWRYAESLFRRLDDLLPTLFFYSAVLVDPQLLRERGV
jgi:hypothetical protein